MIDRATTPRGGHDKSPKFDGFATAVNIALLEKQT